MVRHLKVPQYRLKKAILCQPSFILVPVASKSCQTSLIMARQYRHQVLRFHNLPSYQCYSTALQLPADAKINPSDVLTSFYRRLLMRHDYFPA